MIGAGHQRRPQWRTLDADPDSDADIIATIPPLPASVRAVVWKEIELIHVIEHFYLWESRQLLIELYNVLAGNGKLVIEAPNILYAARVLCGLETIAPGAAGGKFDMWALYGSPHRKNPLYSHRWGYTPESLTQELIDAGFQASKIRVTRARFHVPDRDFRIEAIK